MATKAEKSAREIRLESVVAFQNEFNQLKGGCPTNKTKKEGWINVVSTKMYDETIGFTGEIYKTEEAALKHRTNVVSATIKIEWEE